MSILKVDPSLDHLCLEELASQELCEIANNGSYVASKVKNDN